MGLPSVSLRHGLVEPWPVWRRVGVFHPPGRAGLLQHVSSHTPSSTLVHSRIPALNSVRFVWWERVDTATKHGYGVQVLRNDGVLTVGQ